MTSSLHMVWTLALLLAFVGIILWAWSGRRKTDFEEAAQLPLDDDSQEIKQPRGVKNNG